MKRRMIIDRAGQWHREPYALPVRGQLMPFQAYGAGWLWDRHASLLGDDMGLGKTCQVIEVINRLSAGARVLIICPAGLRFNWLRELATWLTTSRRCQIAKTYVPPVEIVIVNYDKLPRFELQLRAVHWDLAVIDEAHTIQNAWATKCRQILGDEFTEPLRADRKILMTGTPMPNRPINLWTQLRFLGLRMSREAYGKRFCGGGSFQGCTHPEELRDILRCFMLRRTKAQVLTDLPPKSRQVVRIAPAGAARAAVAAELSFERQAARVLKFEGKIPFSHTAALRQATARAKLAMPEVQAILREAAACSGKIIVFGYHNATVDAVAALFPPGRAVTYTGRHTAEERQAAVDRFQTDAGCQVFAGTIGAAGVGITLTAAHHVIFVEEDWTPGMIDQAEDRAWRHGQKNAVTIQHIVLDGSIDARQLEVFLGKQGNISEVVQPTQNAA